MSTKRLKILFESPRFRKDSVDEKSFYLIQEMKIFFDGKKKFIYECPTPGLAQAYMESFLLQNEGRDIQAYEMMGLKEWESYLRDSNIDKAFDIGEFSQSWFEKFQEFFKLIKSIKSSQKICTCFQVSLFEIEQSYLDNDLESLIKTTQLGSKCGSCLRPGKGSRAFYMDDLPDRFEAKKKAQVYEQGEYGFLKSLELSTLDQFNALDDILIFDPLKEGDFQSLSLSRKIFWTEKVMDAKVRPLLKQDGGDLELLDIDDRDVYIEYSGSCVGCSSSQSGTLEYITETLMKEFQDKKINVIVDQ